MSRMGFWFIGLFAAWLVAGCAAQPHGAISSHSVDSPDSFGETEVISQAVLDWFDQAIAHVDEMRPAAEAVADRLLDGGRIYTTGNSGFCEELFFRVGGLPFVRTWPGQGQTPKDVFFMGLLAPNESVPNYARLSSLVAGERFKTNTAVVFASREWLQVSRVLDAARPGDLNHRIFVIDTRVPMGGTPREACLAQIATVAMAWTFQSEVIAAMTRRGKMPATYASGFEPNPGQTDESVQDMIVNPRYTVTPIEPGRLGREYLKTCRDQIVRFAPTQATAVRQAAHRMVERMKSGGLVWAVTQGHLHQGASQVPPELPIKLFGREFTWSKMYAPSLPRKDLLLWLGYVDYPTQEVAQATERGCGVVVATAEQGPPQPDVIGIQEPFTRLDACISISNYPIHMMPTSGVIQSLVWYSLMAETRVLWESR